MIKLDGLTKELKEKIIEMKAEGHSNSSIADFLNGENALTELITQSDVFIWANRQEDNIIKIMKAKGNFDKKMAEKYFNSIEQLNNLNSEAWELLYKLKEDPEMKEKVVSCPHCQKSFKIKIQEIQTLIKTIDTVLKQIQHVDTVLGKLNKKSLNVNYSIVDINTKISKVMPDVIERMQREGTLDNLVRQLKRKKKLLVVQEDNQEEEVPEEDL
jgi:hypothetical protein